MNLGNLKLIIITIFIYSLFSYHLHSKPIEGNLVEMHILDKISAKVTNLKIQVNSSLKFESLNIEIYACYTAPPDEIPEDLVLLKIFDKMEKDNNQLIYQGWMISSSPAATPLEHPIYDLWLQDCK